MKEKFDKDIFELNVKIKYLRLKINSLNKKTQIQNKKYYKLKNRAIDNYKQNMIN